MSREAIEHVEVQLELGHDAVPAKSKEGFTHQWTVFVRGPDGCKIEEFVEKVIFNLHDSFAKPRRSFTYPPFEVTEYGYASFDLPIDIYFKNKEEPKKITYIYDLFLRPGETVSNTRREKLTFQNPSTDFRKKLMRAGGKSSSVPDKSAAPQKQMKQSSASPRTPNSNATASPRDTKTVHKKSSAKPESSSRSVIGKQQQRVPQKDIPIAAPLHFTVTAPASSSSSISSKQQFKTDKPVVAKSSDKPDTFTDLFGPPIQSRPSPEPGKQQKDKEKKQKPDERSKSKSRDEKKESDYSISSAALPEKSHSRNSNHRSSSREAEKSRKKSKSGKKKKKKDSVQNRSDSSRCSSRSSSLESDRRKGTVPTDTSRKSGSRSTSKSKTDSPIDCKTKGKEVPASATSSTTTGASSSSQKSKDVKKENFTSTTVSYINNKNTGTTTLEIKSVKKEKTWDSESKKSKSKEFNKNGEEVPAKEGSSTKAASSSHSRSSKRGTSSSPHSTSSDRLSGTGSGSLPANGSRDDLSSPRSSSGSAGVGRMQSPSSYRRKKQDSGSESDDLIHDRKWKRSCGGGGGDVSDGDEDIRPVRRDDYLTELLWVQKRINETTDPILLQRVVDLIENNTTEFEVTKDTFDFDLLRLDEATLSKLREIVDQG